MHDPSSVAHEIKYPWRKYGKKGTNDFDRSYRETFITIWHRDPEIGGSDDSCGWFTPPFSKELKSIVQSLASDEAREPWFMRKAAKSNDDPLEVERFVFGALVLMSQCMKNRRLIRRDVSLNKITRWAANMTHNNIDSFRGSLCFLSG